MEPVSNKKTSMVIHELEVRLFCKMMLIRTLYGTVIVDNFLKNCCKKTFFCTTGLNPFGEYRKVISLILKFVSLLTKAQVAISTNKQKYDRNSTLRMEDIYVKDHWNPRFHVRDISPNIWIFELFGICNVYE